MLSILFVVVGASVLPASRRVVGRALDVWSPAFFIAMITCFLLLVNQGPTWGLENPRTPWVGLGCVVFGAIFFWVATHVRKPMIDLSLYRSRNFTVAVSAAFISFICLTPVNQLVPFYMEDVQGLHVAETGLIFITTTLMIAITQPFSGRLDDQIGSRKITSIELALQGIGLLSLTLIPLHMDPNWLLPELAIIGFGVGMFRSPSHRALFGAVPRNKVGQAGGYQHLPRQLGESIGETGVIAMFTTVVLGAASAVGIQPPAPVAPTVVPTAVPTPAPQTGAIGGKPIVFSRTSQPHPRCPRRLQSARPAAWRPSAPPLESARRRLTPIPRMTTSSTFQTTAPTARAAPTCRPLSRRCHPKFSSAATS
jgi:hypothetical protein